MSDSRFAALFRDTFVGQLVYYASGHKVLQHPEERPDFVVPERYQRNIGGANKLPQSQPHSYGEKQGKEGTNRAAAPTSTPSWASDLPRRSTSDETVVGDGGRPSSRVQGDKEQGEDPNLVDWYGDDDKENPMNWSVGRKVFVTFCICLITTSVYSGSSIFTPGLLEAMRVWRVGQVAATLGLSMFVIGYGIGPMFLSSATEIPAVGRTIPYIVTLAIFVVLQVPTALTNSYAGYLVLRFLAGFFGSPPLATGGASISDMFAPDTRPFAMGVYGLAAAGGPALGPVVSGFAIQAKNWHWHAWILLWFSGFSLIFLAFTLTETSATNILVRRARRLRKLTGNDELKSQGEIEQAEMTVKDVVMMTIVRPFQMTLMEPIVIALNAYIAFVYAVLYCWFESFPIVYAEGYMWGLGVSQLPFLSLLVGAIIGFAGYAVWNKKYYMPLYKRLNGKVPPEERLPPAFVGSFCYPICLFWFGWSANRTSWVCPTVAAAFFGIGTTLMFMAALNYLSDAYPRYVASVLASNDITRSMFGAGFPLFASIMFKHLGIDWGCSLLGFISIAMIPIPFVLYKYGPKIREHSKMAD